MPPNWFSRVFMESRSVAISNGVISNPTWIADFFEPDRVGGPLVDLHVHDLHWIQLLFGTPTSVDVVGRMRGQVAEYVHVLHRFQILEFAYRAVLGLLMHPGDPLLTGLNCISRTRYCSTSLRLCEWIGSDEFAYCDSFWRGDNTRVASL